MLLYLVAVVSGIIAVPGQPTLPGTRPNVGEFELPMNIVDEGPDSKDYGGIVTAVTADTITIAAQAQEKSRYYFKEGKLVRIETTRTPAQPPRAFAVSDILVRGAAPNSRWGIGYNYRLSDVRVGDVIVIQYTPVKGVDVCELIHISQRPGGKVPFPPGTDEAYWKGKAWWGNPDPWGVGWPPKPVAPPPREKSTEVLPVKP
jgi:hypothetical protein